MDATQPTQRRTAAGTWTIALVVLLLLRASAVVTACGGTSTTTSPSPRVAAASPSATPLRTTTSRGTIAFTKTTKDSQDIYVVCSDGSGLRRLAKDARGPAWSPDGSRLALGND